MRNDKKPGKTGKINQILNLLPDVPGDVTRSITLKELDDEIRKFFGVYDSYDTQDMLWDLIRLAASSDLMREYSAIERGSFFDFVKLLKSIMSSLDAYHISIDDRTTPFAFDPSDEVIN